MDEHPPMQDDFHASHWSCFQHNVFEDGTSISDYIPLGRYFISPLNWKGKENFMIPMLTLGMPISVPKMKKLITFWKSKFLIFQGKCFLCGTTTMGYRHGYLTSNVCTMEILNGTIKWTILSLIPHMVLLSSS